MTRDECRVRLGEIESRLKNIDDGYKTRSMRQKAKDKWNALVDERKEVETQLEESETRPRYLEGLGPGVNEEEDRVTNYNWKDDPGVKYNRALMHDNSPERSQGLRAIEDLQRDGLSSTAADRLDTLFRSQSSAKDAVYLRAVSSPAYARAWLKRCADPEHGHHTYTPEEADAMRQSVIATRSIGLGTQGGQSAVPAALDPSVKFGLGRSRKLHSSGGSECDDFE